MSGLSDPAVEEARRARAAQAALAAEGERPQPLPPPSPQSPPIPDPLSLCIYTTVALLAWLFSPGLTVTVFGFAGLRAYSKAWRAGLRRSDCLLRDPRLVMLYLALAGAAGLVWTVWRAAGWLSHRAD